MEKYNDTQFLNNLEQQKPSKIIELIRSIKEERVSIPENFNWLGLAQVSSLNARTDKTNNLLWAMVAIEAYNFSMKNVDCRESNLRSIMFLRVYFIERYGSKINDPILDFNQVVQWFFQSLTISLNEAKEIADNWNELDIDKIKELRKIKNRLAVFKELSTSLLEPYPELREWIMIYNKLP